MLLQSLLHREVKVTWLYECLCLRWPCHRKSPEQHSKSMIDPKKYQGWKKKKKKLAFFFCSGRVLVKEMKMRGSSEITHKLNDDKTECFIQWFVNLQGHLAFESNRNSCAGCSYQIHDSGHLSTRDSHPYCTSRPFCSFTCCYTVYLALLSLLYCGITPPGLHSSPHLIDLSTWDQSELQSCSQSFIIGWTTPSTQWMKTSHLHSLQLLTEKVHLIPP